MTATFWSHHALRQMKDRAITRGEVLDAIADYAYSYLRSEVRSQFSHTTSPPTRVYVGTNGITVVVELPHNGKERKILTAARKDQLLNHGR